MPDQQITDFLAGVVGVVEANSFETMSLWETYANKRKTPWKENLSGLLVTVGELDNAPVCISLQTAEVGGEKLLFFEATSRIVDHRQIDQWLADNVPDTAKREGRINRSDAMNFHNVLRRH